MTSNENKIDLIGQKFGRLIVVKYIEKYQYLYQCDCGNKKIVRIYDLKRGHTKSCGCLNIEKITQRSIKHGHLRGEKATKIYSVWATIIQRCTNANNKRYKYYGGRGITVCNRWLKFENFNEDMGESYKPRLMIERRNNEEGYSHKNCYWATWEEQNRNKRNNLYVQYNGKKRLLIKLCEEYNRPYRLVYQRIYKYGWSVEKALMTSIRKHEKYKKRKNNET